jgi:hypothetical protein
VLEGAAQAVEPPDHEGVPGPQDFHQAQQFGPVDPAARLLFLVKPLAARLPQGVPLQVQVLVVAADTCVADIHDRIVPEVSSLAVKVGR